jgi:hypothetical protein
VREQERAHGGREALGSEPREGGGGAGGAHNAERRGEGAAQGERVRGKQKGKGKQEKEGEAAKGGRRRKARRAAEKRSEIWTADDIDWGSERGNGERSSRER